MSRILSKIKLNTFAIILAIVGVVAVMTWIVPSGAYDKMEVDGRQIVVAGTYHSVPANPQGLFDVLKAPVQGFSNTAEVIVFLLFIGGVLSVVEKTGAIAAGIQAASAFFQRRPNLRFLFIPLGIITFSLCGATFGMCEEALIFIPIFIPLALSLGYDSALGTAIPFIGAGVGFAAAFTNPFTVGIAQGIAQVPLYSGLGYRLIIWAICTCVVITWLSFYARKIRKNPQASLTYEFDIEKRKELKLNKEETHITRRQKWVLLAFGLGMVGLIIGVLKPQICSFIKGMWGIDLMQMLHLEASGWYITEIAALFLGVGFLCGILGRMKMSQFNDAFFDGVRGMAEIAVLLCFAQAIVIIANNGHILDTMLNWMSSGIKHLHPVCASWAAMMLQTVIDFFIPSGSGKAVLTMPILAPLADLIGITRQTMVLAFQLGGSWLNMVIPTDPVTIAAIGFARIAYGKWLKWMLPLLLLMYVLSFIFLVPPYLMKWQ
ncbi:YfcC family protein [Candidatus Avelusimicrobium aviculae]|uniref:YfcC family protein n=1 Tax=Candidatus Avelusimicrobium aviculae TaxID=3416206 RepID=UPI003D0AC69C